MKNRISVLGINFRYLALKYKIKSKYWHKDWKHIERCIITYAETTRSDSDYYVGNTVRELCVTLGSPSYFSNTVPQNRVFFT